MYMIRADVCPKTLAAIRRGLQYAGIQMGSSQVSAGPLFEPQVRAVEQHLEQVTREVGETTVIEKIDLFLSSGHGSIVVMYDRMAAAARNGEDPRSDLSLLLEMAREGDL